MSFNPTKKDWLKMIKGIDDPLMKSTA